MGAKIRKGLKDTKQLFELLWGRLITSIVIGLVTLFLTILLKIYPQYALDIYTAIIVSILVFMFYVYKDSLKIYNSRNRIEKADLFYKDIIDGHENLPGVYSSYVDSLLIDTDFKKGIALTNVSDSTYKKIIEQCSDKTNESYCACLSYPYSIKNIFNPKDGAVTIGETIDYMQEMNKNISSNVTRKRLFVFSKLDFIKDIKGLKDFHDSDIVDFFRYQYNYKLYFIDKTKLENGSNIDLQHKYRYILSSDFAIFDNSITFLRTDEYNLSFFSVNNDYETLPGLFKDVFIPDTYKYFDNIFYHLSETMTLIKDNKDKFNKDKFNKDNLLKALMKDLDIDAINNHEST